MKKFKLLALLFLAIPIAASAQKYEASSNMERTFAVSPSPEFTSNVKFANVIITHWDRNDIRILAEFKAKACSNEMAELLLEVAKVNFTKTANGVLLKSEYDSDLNNKIQKKCKGTSLEITFRVSLPRKTAITTDSQFGNVNIDKVESRYKANVKFGNVKVTGKISADATINIEFGNVTIADSDGNVKIDARHGNASVGSVKNIQFSSQFGNVKIESAGDVRGLSKHGNMTIGTAKTVVMTSAQFGNFTIGLLEQKLEISELSHSTLNVKGVSSGFNSILVPNASFSDVKLCIPSGSFEAELKTSFGNTRIYDDKFDGSVYKTVGGGNPTAKVKVSNSHANITITR